MGLFDSFKKKSPARKPIAGATENAASAKLIKVSDYLSEKNIAFFSAGPSKHQALGNLIGALDLPDPGAAMKAILAREEAGSTVIAPRLALPHARLMGLKKIVAALGICPSGVLYPAPEGGPIYVIMLFLGPAENMREHLAFLAGVSSLFQTEGLIDALTQLITPQAVLEKIREIEKTLAL